METISKLSKKPLSTVDIPSWVENPENDFTTKKTKKPLKSAMKFIKSRKQLASEKPLQSVANFVFPRLISESFRNLKFGMQYSYRSQLRYRSCKEDDFLPTNFNNSAGNGMADVAILIDLPNTKKFPILVGELKTKVYFQELSPSRNPQGKKSDYLQLFNYMLTVQRPYSVKDNGSHLIGFLMDYEEAFIFHLRVWFWTDFYIVPSTVEFLLLRN